MLHLTAKIIRAYVRSNSVAAVDLPALIRITHAALVAAATPEAVMTSERLVPAVPVKKSVEPDAIICLECGKRQQMLKRHLAVAHNLSVDEYRTKWALPRDYPVVAPNYAAQRSALALKIGLGRKKKGAETAKSEQSGYRYPTSRWSKPTA